jgi:hypothetical protein
MAFDVLSKHPDLRARFLSNHFLLHVEAIDVCRVLKPFEDGKNWLRAGSCLRGTGEGSFRHILSTCPRSLKWARKGATIGLWPDRFPAFTVQADEDEIFGV